MRFVRLYDVALDCVWDKSGNRGEVLDAFSCVDEFGLIVWVLSESLESLNYKGE